MIFNVGARRSGTYWLQRITCAHPAVAEVPSETYVFSHGIAPLMERFHHDDPAYEEVGQVYADRARVIADIRDLCDTVFGEFVAGRADARRRAHSVARLPPAADRRGLSGCQLRPHHSRRPRCDALDRRAAVGAGQREGRRRGVAQLGRRRDATRPRGSGTGCSRCDTRKSSPTRGRRSRASTRITGSRAGSTRRSKRRARRRTSARQDNRVGSGKWREGWGRRELRDFDRVAGDLLRELGYDQG